MCFVHCGKGRIIVHPSTLTKMIKCGGAVLFWGGGDRRHRLTG